jgi:hypothetical protein
MASQPEAEKVEAVQRTAILAGKKLAVVFVAM